MPSALLSGEMILLNRHRVGDGEAGGSGRGVFQNL